MSPVRGVSVEQYRREAFIKAFIESEEKRLSWKNRCKRSSDREAMAVSLAASDEDSAPLDIRLFGSFEMHLNGALISPPRSRKARWLLALLVLKRERPVDREW